MSLGGGSSGRVVIERDPVSAAAESYDLVVVGGGIYGCMVALEAARRGLRAVVVEREDFGAATSWNSLRIVHGGLRYLQSLDLPRFFESVAERRWFLRHFPEQVAPLHCLMPLYRSGLRRPGVLRVAFALNDVLSATRNRGVRSDRRISSGRLLSVEATKQRFPKVDARGLAGAALWSDAAMPDSQSLMMEVLRWAVAAGACALNYVEATGLTVEAGRVRAVSARDRESDTELELRAPVVVNCAGPWATRVAEGFDRPLPQLFAPSLAFNLLLDRPALSDAALAVAPPVRGSHTYFLVPWKGRILAGTAHAPWEGPPGSCGPRPEQIQGFLADIEAAIPGLGLRVQDVVRVHAGLIPAARRGTEELAVRPVLVDHAAQGGPEGLWSLSGVKWTTARRVAEHTLQRIYGSARSRRAPNRPPPVERLEGARLDELLRGDRDRVRKVVQQIAREEAVVHLDDLLLRRTGWLLAEPRPAEHARAVAEFLDWDDARRECELERLAAWSTAHAPLAAA